MEGKRIAGKRKRTEVMTVTALKKRVGSERGGRGRHAARGCTMALAGYVLLEEAYVLSYIWVFLAPRKCRRISGISVLTQGRIYVDLSRFS